MTDVRDTFRWVQLGNGLGPGQKPGALTSVVVSGHWLREIALVYNGGEAIYWQIVASDQSARIDFGGIRYACDIMFAGLDARSRQLVISMTVRRPIIVLRMISVARARMKEWWYDKLMVGGARKGGHSRCQSDLNPGWMWEERNEH